MWVQKIVCWVQMYVNPLQDTREKWKTFVSSWQELSLKSWDTKWDFWGLYEDSIPPQGRICAPEAAVTESQYKLFELKIHCFKINRN